MTKNRKYPPVGAGDYLTEHVARMFSRTVDAERIIQELENSMPIICNMQPREVSTGSGPRTQVNSHTSDDNDSRDQIDT